MEITLLVLLPAARDWGDLRSLFSLQSVFLAAACRVPGARVRGGEGGRGEGRARVRGGVVEGGGSRQKMRLC